MIHAATATGKRQGGEFVSEVRSRVLIGGSDDALAGQGIVSLLSMDGPRDHQVFGNQKSVEHS